MVSSLDTHLQLFCLPPVFTHLARRNLFKEQLLSYYSNAVPELLTHEKDVSFGFEALYNGFVVCLKEFVDFPLHQFSGLLLVTGWLTTSDLF